LQPSSSTSQEAAWSGAVAEWLRSGLQSR